LNGTSVFLGALFAMSAIAAMKLLRGRPGISPWSGAVVPLAGALTLCGIIAVDVAQSDAVTRAIEIGGLLLGAPFAVWRGRAGVRLESAA